MREFPLDNLAAAASMLARCAGEGKSFPLISVLFAKQDDWAFVKGDPRPELLKFAKQAGFTQESFEKCLTDQKLLDDISAVRTRAADTFGVNRHADVLRQRQEAQRRGARGLRQGVRPDPEELTRARRGVLCRAPDRIGLDRRCRARRVLRRVADARQPVVGRQRDATAALQQPGATPDAPRPSIPSASSPPPPSAAAR